MQGHTIISVGMYANGKGVPKNQKKAIEWYTKAAKQGDVWPQYNLGHMYYYGRGVPQDYSKAYMWFNLATHNGYSEGQKARDTVAKKLSSKDLIEAQKMAQRCLKSEYKDC